LPTEHLIPPALYLLGLIGLAGYHTKVVIKRRITLIGEKAKLPCGGHAVFVGDLVPDAKDRRLYPAQRPVFCKPFLKMLQ
jgi:hypothetical protein